MFKKVTNKLVSWFFHHQSLSGYLEPVIQQFIPAWRSGYFRANVIDVKAVEHGYVYLTLAPQSSWAVNNESHKAGQHIELTLEINGRLLTRIFTIASPPESFKQTKEITLLIKTNKLGRFTGAITQSIAVGSWCNISLPQGDFLFESTTQPVIMVAGGSGITPIISMLAEHINTFIHPTYLRYIAEAGQHQFVNLLEGLAAKNEKFTFELTTRAQHEKIPLIFDEVIIQDVYCCGPAGLMQSIKHQASQSKGNYFQEQFSIGIIVNENQSSFNAVFDNENVEINNETTLLEQFEQKELNVTRGCGIGVCHQCVCNKKSGLVKNLRTGEISDNGEQLIQLCISQPLSDLEITS